MESKVNLQNVMVVDLDKVTKGVKLVPSFYNEKTSISHPRITT